MYLNLSTRRFHRLPPTAIVDRQHVPRRPNKYVSRRSFIRRRWSETLEQPANLSSPAWSEPWSISTSTQDESVSGCMTAALSDYLLFQRRYINILTYLLTYIHTHPDSPITAASTATLPTAPPRQANCHRIIMLQVKSFQQFATVNCLKLHFCSFKCCLKTF